MICARFLTMVVVASLSLACKARVKTQGRTLDVAYDRKAPNIALILGAPQKSPIEPGATADMNNMEILLKNDLSDQGFTITKKTTFFTKTSYLYWKRLLKMLESAAHS